MSQMDKGGARMNNSLGAQKEEALAWSLVLSGFQYNSSTRAVRTAERAFNCHCKYYHCLWYAEKQEEQHLLLPGGRRTTLRAG